MINAINHTVSLSKECKQLKPGYHRKYFTFSVCKNKGVFSKALSVEGYEKQVQLKHNTHTLVENV